MNHNSPLFDQFCLETSITKDVVQQMDYGRFNDRFFYLTEKVSFQTNFRNGIAAQRGEGIKKGP